MPNSFTDFVKVDKEKIAMKIQTMAAKLKLCLRGQMENEVDHSQALEDEESEADMACKRVYQNEQKAAALRITKAPISKHNKRIQVPRPVNKEKIPHTGDTESLDRWGS